MLIACYNVCNGNCGLRHAVTRIVQARYLRNLPAPITRNQYARAPFITQEWITEVIQHRCVVRPVLQCSVLFFCCPRSEGYWPHHGRTFSAGLTLCFHTQMFFDLVWCQCFMCYTAFHCDVMSLSFLCAIVTLNKKITN